MAKPSPASDQAQQARSIPVHLEETSPEPRQHWATVVLPNGAIDQDALMRPLEFVGENGERFPARGTMSWNGRKLLHIQTTLGGNQRLRGKVMDAKEHGVHFGFHPWVVDDISKLYVELGVQFTTDQPPEWSVADQVIELENTPARRVWWMRARIPAHGLILEFWLHVYSNDCVCPFYAKVVWSNRKDPAWNKVFPALWLRCGEALHFNFKTRHGVVGNDKDAAGRYRYLLGQQVPFCDGAALPLSGSMLCFRDQMDKLTDAQREQSVRNIRAAAHDEAGTFGVHVDRDGSWMSLKHIPRVAQDVAKTADANLWAAFANSLNVPSGFFVKRDLGISKTPGQTGNQEDFAATKGTLVLYGYPRHLMRMRYSVQADLLRGVHHYESTGKPISLADHPNWVTWSCITHYHSGVSPDRLGKESPQEPANGWRGYDDQHRSQNNLTAYLELFDDPLILDHTFHQQTTDKANYRRRFPNNGPDAARGQGRCVQAHTNLNLSTNDKQWLALIDAQVKQSHAFMHWLGQGPMRVLSTNGPDGRVPVYVDGKLAPTVSLWEHGLALVGFRAAQSVLVSPQLTDIVQETSKLLLDWAISAAPGGGYHKDTSIHWNGGAPPLSALADNNSGVMGWIDAGLRVALEVLPSHPKAAMVRDYLRGAVQEPDPRIEWAEWWAAAEAAV